MNDFNLKRSPHDLRICAGNRVLAMLRYHTQQHPPQTTIACYVDNANKLCEYKTGRVLRAATSEEIAESTEAAERDGGVGAIEISRGVPPPTEICEFTVWFDADLSRVERDIVISNYLSELLKGT